MAKFWYIRKDDMIIPVIPKRIPKIWETIKFAATQADGIERGLEAYLNDMLHALLSNKAQCFVRTNEKQTEIKAVIVTRLLFDKFTQEKYLLLQSYYAFEAASDQDWLENMEFAIDFSKKEKCSYISFTSNNERILELANLYGFKERNRKLDFRLGG
jgi:hypothetical protein